MISVVLPVYNGEKYLRQSINSILNQTYKDFELIIVNDCSTDSSLEIMKSYISMDKRIKIISNSTNQKLPQSLNIGFNECNGDYYTWTSDDNIMLPNALEKLLFELEKNDADLVFSRCETIDAKGKILGKTKIYKDLDELLYNNIVLASFLYKKEVHEKLGGYDTNKFLVEDYDFWLRAYKNYKFHFVPDILYQIRFHGANLGNTRLEGVKIGKVELLKDNIKGVSDPQIIENIYREISNCYFDVSNIYYKKLSMQNNKAQIIGIRGKDLLKKVIGK